MKRVRLIVSYDGTNYCGWQVQDNETTVAGVINEHLSELLGEEINIAGASRTDSGVHALGNVAVFDTETQIPAEKICFALNQRLPEDIRIQESDEVSADWHPRFQDSKKTYEYTIINRRFPDPTKRLYAHWEYGELDAETMKEAAEYLVGEHDFASFCSAGGQQETTIREIYSINVEKEGDIITIRVQGNGFLYNMVRIIAGTLIEIGKGTYEASKMKEILDAKDRNEAGPTARANGLKLVEIEYENA